MQNKEIKDRLSIITTQAQRFFGVSKVNVKEVSSNVLLEIVNQQNKAARFAFMFEFASTIKLPTRKRIRGYTKALLKNMIELHDIVDRIRVFVPEWNIKITNESFIEFRYWILIYKFMLDENVPIIELMTARVQRYMASHITSLSLQGKQALIDSKYWTPAFTGNLALRLVDAFNLAKVPCVSSIRILKGNSVRLLAM